MKIFLSFLFFIMLVSQNSFAMSRAISNAGTAAYDTLKWIPTYRGWTAGNPESDQRLIEELNAIIIEKSREVPSVFETAFPGGGPVAERTAAHELLIRVYIYNSRIPQSSAELFRDKTEDEKLLAIAYLSAIEQGLAKAEELWPSHFSRIKSFAEQFLRIVAAQETPLERSQDGEGLGSERIRPPAVTAPIFLTSRRAYHPVTAIMLGELRRLLFPEKQKIVDEHFHRLNIESRPRAIAAALSGSSTTELLEDRRVTRFERSVPIEFYPCKNVTDVLPYELYMQGESILTTVGTVTRFEFSTGSIAYLIKYVDYKAVPVMEKYLVSKIIPIGAKGEEYIADLSEGDALKEIEKLQ